MENIGSSKGEKKKKRLSSDYTNNERGQRQTEDKNKKRKQSYQSNGVRSDHDLASKNVPLSSAVALPPSSGKKKKLNKKKRERLKRLHDEPKNEAVNVIEPKISATLSSISPTRLKQLHRAYLSEKKKSQEEGGDNPQEKFHLQTSNNDVETHTVVIGSTAVVPENPKTRQNSNASKQHVAVGSGGHHPFKVDPSDHAETPIEAYQDINQLLNLIANTMGKKTKKDLIIYDPYYCDGGMKNHLRKMGFPNVINVNEDFYANVATGNLPKYDVLLTNPPYSGEHIPKLLEFCKNQTKPWIVLVPNYVYYKPYYLQLYPSSSSGPSSVPQSYTSALPSERLPSTHPFYLIPKQRYTYFAPSWQQSEHKKKLSGATAPYVSIFICDLKQFTTHKMVIKYFSGFPKPSSASTSSTPLGNQRLELACCAEEVPYRARTEADPMRSSKRPNPKQRKKMRQQQLHG